MRQNWHADRIVASVDRDDAPILILETEKTSLLAQHPSIGIGKPELREQHIEIANTIGVHFVIPIQSEAALSTVRSGDPGIAVHWLAEPIFLDFVGIPNVIDIA